MYVQSPQYQTLQQLKHGTGKSISQLLREAIFGYPPLPKPAELRQRYARRNDVTPIDCLPIATAPHPAPSGLRHSSPERGRPRSTCTTGSTQQEVENDLAQVAELTRKLAQHPNSVILWIQRGLFHMQLKLSQEAAQDFSQAIRLAPNLAQAYYKRSQAYYMLGKEQLAAQDRQLAKQLFSGERWC